MATLRAEIDALRESYEAKLQALDARLRAAEAALAPATPAQPAQAAASAPMATAEAAPPAAPAPAAAPAAVAAGGGANAFNPAMSLILSGLYDPHVAGPGTLRDHRLPAAARCARSAPARAASASRETELGLSASIDPWLRGAANIALQPDNTVSVEEAFVQTTSLGNGLTLKAGRFFSGIGYLNPQHAHTWDFVDAPLAYQAMLGTQFGDDGVQLRWLAPTDQYLELGVEVGRGRSFPAATRRATAPGMAALALHTGGDIGDSHSWRAGLSCCSAKASDQALTQLDATGIADRPASSTAAPASGSPTRSGSGRRTATPRAPTSSCRASTCAARAAAPSATTSRAPTCAGDYRAASVGLVPAGRSTSSCRAGASACAPSGSTPARPTTARTPTLFDASGYQPRKNTLMLDFSPSEFSRVRLQFARDRARKGFTDNQVFLQYQMSLGAHGAHSY